MQNLDLSLLPTELKYEILKWLPYRDKVRVCKTMYQREKRDEENYQICKEHISEYDSIPYYPFPTTDDVKIFPSLNEYSIENDFMVIGRKYRGRLSYAELDELVVFRGLHPGTLLGVGDSLVVQSLGSLHDGKPHGRYYIYNVSCHTYGYYFHEIFELVYFRGKQLYGICHMGTNDTKPDPLISFHDPDTLQVKSFQDIYQAAEMGGFSVLHTTNYYSKVVFEDMKQKYIRRSMGDVLFDRLKGHRFNMCITYKSNGLGHVTKPYPLYGKTVIHVIDVRQKIKGTVTLNFDAMGYIHSTDMLPAISVRLGQREIHRHFAWYGHIVEDNTFYPTEDFGMSIFNALCDPKNGKIPHTLMDRVALYLLEVVDIEHTRDDKFSQTTVDMIIFYLWQCGINF